MNNDNRKLNVALPFLFAIVLAFGMIIGSQLRSSDKHSVFSFNINPANKINQLLNYIEKKYVDTISVNSLEEYGINGILNKLDPHSSYIPQSEFKAINEPLEGNFDGIGIEFNIVNDTIMVIAALSGGPSEALGIHSGDRIIKIEDENVAGINITNIDVIKKLRGQRGTKVKVGIYRKGNRALINFIITRDKIPINSLDVAYMINNETGYIKISRFSQTTYNEYLNSFKTVQSLGMKNLILDLRGNPGGYLTISTQLSDEFLDDGKLIVYTHGKEQPQQNYYATSKGSFEKGNLIILIDEGSASASEIVAGAVQDWDRGLIIGRRSFGKGLVQEQTEFPDGSAIRLTIAKYFTPTGRCIQKPYNDGNTAYYSETIERYLNGENLNTDSIHFDESLKFFTPQGRTVYGGGGIMPDVFVPVDTSGYSIYFNNIIINGLISRFAFNFVDENRNELKNQYKNFNEFKQHFTINANLLNKFVSFANEQGIEANWYEINISKDIIKTHLKAHIARQIWNNDGFYPVIHEIDNTFQKAIEIISNL